MSKNLHYDLDELNGESFQELCSAIVLDEFTPLAIPYGSPGKDGGLDARHVGELISYSTLFDTPHKINSPGGENITWVFQAKHTKRDRETNRQKAVVNALKDEIFKWLDERWDDSTPYLPTCFILMTNVNLTPKTRNELEELGSIFEYFECWDEGKIAPFIALKESVRRTFFPNKDDRIMEHLKSLTTLSPIQKEIKAETKVPAKKMKVATPPPDIMTFALAVEKLVNYEIYFTQQNNALAELLEFGKEDPESISEWPIAEVKSFSNGLLALSEDKSALEKLVELIRAKNVKLYVWNRFIGEETKKDETILTLKYHENFKKEVEAISKKVFTVIEGENKAHLEVDGFLVNLQSDILKNLEEKKYILVERQLSDFFQARKNYLDKKKNLPTAFYPNTRLLGGRAVFGWDFIKTWEKIYEDILEIVLKGSHPSDVVDNLLYMPFGLCHDVVIFGNPHEQFASSFDLVRRLLFVLREKGTPKEVQSFFERYKRMCEEISDTRFSINNLDDAERTFKNLKSIFHHLLQLLKDCLDGKDYVTTEVIESFLAYITSANFHGIIENWASEGGWEAASNKEKHYHGELSKLRDEFYFAWATYSWHKLRKDSQYDFKSIAPIIDKVSLPSIIDLYEKTKQKDSDWFSWWFRPEASGRVTSWWSSIDHDIRELLIAILLTREFDPVQLLGLGFLESASSVTDFIKDMNELSSLMTSAGQEVDLENCIDKIKSAEKIIEKKIEDEISRTSEFSSRKLKNIKETFSKKMSENTHEGILYQIREGLDRNDIKFQAGVYSIFDKVWFIENRGHVSYGADTFGSSWAEAITRGRVQLIVLYLKEVLSLPGEHISVQDFLDKISNLEDEFCLLINHRSIPWSISYKYIKHRDTSTGTNESYIGNTRVIYESKNLKPGEAYLIPKSFLIWKILKRVDEPSIYLIDPSSKEGQSIRKNNPDMDISLKVLVDARELGSMELDGDSKSIQRYLLKGLDFREDT